MKHLSLRLAAGLLAALAAIGLVAVTIEFFTPASGIDGTPGALLAIVASALILGATIVVGFPPAIPAGLHWTLEILILLGVIGTLAAAWFLESWVLLGCMALGLVVQVVRLFNVKPLLPHRAGTAPQAS